MTEIEDDPMNTQIIISLKAMVLFNLTQADFDNTNEVPNPILASNFYNSRSKALSKTDFFNEIIACGVSICQVIVI